MVAFHVQRGVTVPLSAAEFYAGLAQRFPEHDGMYSLPEQVAEYDKNRMKVKEVLQLQRFVTDETTAIPWLKQQLTRKPQTFQELHPQFLKEIGGWQEELRNLPKDGERLRVKAKDRWYVPGPATWRSSASGPAARVRGVPRIQVEAPEGLPPRGRPHRFQEGMAGAGLRHHHRRGAQDPPRTFSRRTPSSSCGTTKH